MERSIVETMAAYRRRRNNFKTYVKNLLKGKPFFSGGTYVNEHKKRKVISFTEELRNKKGYDKYLKKRKL